MDPEPGNLASVILLQTDWTELLTQIGQYILFVLLLVASFFASGSEAAFFSLTKAEIKDLKDDDSARAQRVWRLINRPKKLLATILITNNFMNVGAILVASNLMQVWSRTYAWGDSLKFLIEVVLITSLLLFFGEIIPKVYATRNHLRMVKILAIPMEGLQWFFTPLAKLLIEGTSFIEKRVKLKEEATSRDDLRHAIALTTDPEEDKEEQEILRGIVNFSNITVKSVMRARVDVVAVDLHLNFDELVDLIRSHNFSRLPVYEESLDHIKGVLHIKDLLPFLKENSKPVPISEVMREVYFIPESKKIDSLLEEFKTQRLHMAVVVDEFGGTAGIITLEDIIEEIFGEINDEFDSEDWVYTKVDEKTYIFEGRISLIDVKKILGLDEHTFEDARGDSDSLAGLILELHGKIPSAGEVIQYQNYALHVEGVSKHRITQVKFVIHEEVLEEE